MCRQYSRHPCRTHSVSVFRLWAHSLRWPPVGGPGAPEHRRCVSYVVREMVMSSMWSEFGGQEVPHLLHAELVDKVMGHTY
jgi:hypothetical protein